MIKHLIKENKLLYTLYFHLFRKHRGIRPTWFTKDTEMYIDGYPRSGNTFLIHFTKNVLKNTKCVHHLHSIAPVKIAIEKNILIFILIRKPSDAITSNYLKHFAMRDGELPDQVNKNLLMDLTVNYYRYYRFINQNIKHINLISFDDLIKSPNEAIDNIAKTLNLSIDQKALDEALHSYRGATDKLGSSKPSEFKQNKKMELLNYLKQSQDYKQANVIYNKIVHQKHNFID